MTKQSGEQPESIGASSPGQVTSNYASSVTAEYLLQIGSVSGGIQFPPHPESGRKNESLDSIQPLLREVTADRRVPTLTELSDEALGATPTRYSEEGTAPYVPRPVVDNHLRSKLRERQRPYPFVILVGDSKSGKTRAAIESARSALDETTSILIAKDGKSLEILANASAENSLLSTPTLVWLDDLTAITLNHLTGTTLLSITQWAMIVGTMTWQRYNQIIHSQGDITASARTALYRAHLVELPFESDESELKAARALYPGEEFTGSIAETLVAGKSLAARLKSGQSDHPHGVATVQAVIDWKRAGMERPIRLKELNQLLPPYLEALGVHLPASSADVEQGLKWALEPAASKVSLIHSRSYQRDKLDDDEKESILLFREETLGLYDESGWVPLDYVVQETDGSEGLHRHLPDHTWDKLIEILAPIELHDIAVEANTRGKRDVVYKILEVFAAEAEERRASTGLAHEERGEYDKARKVYEDAIDSGHPRQMSEGHALLGILLFKQGNFNESFTHLQMVTEVSTAPGSVAKIVLAEILNDEYSDPQSAETALTSVLNHGDLRARNGVRQKIASLRISYGNYDGTIEICRQALEDPKEDHNCGILIVLAWALLQKGELTEAEKVGVQAANQGTRSESFQAWSLISEIREAQGDTRGARRACERALELESPD